MTTSNELKETIRAELPVIEVIRDEVKNAWSLKYSIGKEHVQTMLIDQDISEQDKISIVLKVVAAANIAYASMSLDSIIDRTIAMCREEVVPEKDSTKDASEYERADRIAWNSCHTHVLQAFDRIEGKV